MDSLPAVGLVVALLGVPALQLATRVLGGEPFKLWSRLALWFLATIVLGIAVASYSDWRVTLGLTLSDWHWMTQALIATTLTLAAWPVVQLLQRALGASTVVDTDSFKKIAAMPFAYRVFLVLTAGITEEVLYRGYGIGVGKLLLGGMPTAFAVSLLIFVAAHFRWGASHLLSVLWAGAVLSALFVLTNSLLACIVAHVLIDAVGLILAPAGIAWKARRAKSAAGGV
jgi:uncharacterized protein